jgi:hypothetical protein
VTIASVHFSVALLLFFMGAALASGLIGTTA